jgi:diguanylate cyclase (GGDEF)-like protein
MPSGEYLLAPFAVATAAAMALAALIGAALTGRGPLYRRVQSIGRLRTGRRDEAQAAPASAPATGDEASGHAVEPPIRLLARHDRPLAATALWRDRPSEDELTTVLGGSFADETFNRALRVLAWSLILTAMAVVLISHRWQPVEPQIFATLTLAGGFVLVVHEFLPSSGLGNGRFLLEASGTTGFLTALVLLTGNAISPFFFVFPLLAGGAALIAARPRVTFILALETAAAYGIVAWAGWVNGDSTSDSLIRVGINIAALLLLVYAGTAVARVQRRTRDAAIRLSTIDSLTDIFNRAFFFNAVEREIQRSQRFQRGFCLLMMDLDGLKSINDRYGHYQGDLVLRDVARIISGGLRKVDVAARYGGDEFVALLPETDASGGYRAAEKIRLGVNELTIESEGQTINVSISTGIVSYPEGGETADALLIAADQAMYSSKSLGKNMVVGYADLGNRSGGPSPSSGNGPGSGGGGGGGAGRRGERARSDADRRDQDPDEFGGRRPA